MDSKDDQFVEDAIMYTEPCEFKLKDEPLGESLAIRDTDAGFVTTSDGQSHPPLYFYEFNWYVYYLHIGGLYFLFSILDYVNNFFFDILSSFFQNYVHG